MVAVFAAHNASCDRPNVSSTAVVNAAVGSGDYTKAMATAILSIGGLHAPLAETINLLKMDDPAAGVRKCLENGWRVPGWGNSFEKGHPDPLWADFEKLLFADAGWNIKFNAITKTLHDAGKDIYPNPSAYTAACAISIGLPDNLAPYLFIAGRLSAWTAMVGNCLNAPPREM